jgi:mRNA-degrading endonuclease RelE of RelBE toxin-antitoxin system
MYKVIFTRNALGDLRYLRKYDQKRVRDNINKYLLIEPTVEINDRKQLRPNNTSQWELRVEELRIMYDVDEENKIIEIKTVGWKVHNQLFVRGKEYDL